MSTKKFLMLGILSLSLLGSGCSERSQAESAISKQQEVVKIGVIAPLSGPNAGY